MSFFLFHRVMFLAVSMAAMEPIQATDRPESLQPPSRGEQGLKPGSPPPPPPAGPKPPKEPPRPKPEDATWSEIKTRYGRRP